VHAKTAEASLQEIRADVNRRKILDQVFVIVGLLIMFSALLVLVLLFLDLVQQGAPRLNWDFLTSFPSRKAERAGILSAWVGTSLIMLTTAAVSMPVGVAAAIYLEEYAPKNWLTAIIEINVTSTACWHLGSSSISSISGRASRRPVSRSRS
jgi:phosphate transport system permease protein